MCKRQSVISREKTTSDDGLPVGEDRWRAVLEEKSARAVARARRADRVAGFTFKVAAAACLVVLAFIVGMILARGLGTAVKPSFLLGKPRVMGEGGGIGPMVFSSLYLTLVTTLILTPLGVGAGLYLAEYSRGKRLVGLLRWASESLSSISSVVFGIFGMVFFVIYLRLGYSILAGALTLALMNLPTVMRVTEEAVRAVPASYREASLSLGASRWETTKRVVFPAALPGIITGVILTMGRVMGESAALVYTVGVIVRKPPFSPLQPGAPMAAHIWYLYTEGGIVPDWMRIASGEAAALLVLVLLMNLFARVIASKIRKKMGIIG
ncbi:MAG: phosphate ABC transporter permease PstA [Candidatus Geothermincolales bacterium]